MQGPKSLKVVHDNLKESLHEWLRAKKRFEDESLWPEGRYSPYSVFQRIEEASDDIESSYRKIRHEVLERESKGIDEHFLLTHLEYIRYNSIKMREALDDGVNAMLEISRCDYPNPLPRVFVTWQAVCRCVASFARSASLELKDLRMNYQGVDDGGFVHSAVSLDVTAKSAMISRNVVITGYLRGPLSKYACEDAKDMGLLIRDRED